MRACIRTFAKWVAGFVGGYIAMLLLCLEIPVLEQTQKCGCDGRTTNTLLGCLAITCGLAGVVALDVWINTPGFGARRSDETDLEEDEAGDSYEDELELE